MGLVDMTCPPHSLVSLDSRTSEEEFSMSDADDQLGGTDDDFAKKPGSPASEDPQPKESGDDPENDNDVMTDDDLPSGG